MEYDTYLMYFQQEHTCEHDSNKNSFHKVQTTANKLPHKQTRNQNENQSQLNDQIHKLETL